MATDPAGELAELSSKLASIEAVLDPDAMRKEADEPARAVRRPGSVEDQENAQAVTQAAVLPRRRARPGWTACAGRLDDLR